MLFYVTVLKKSSNFWLTLTGEFYGKNQSISIMTVKG